MVVSDCTVEFDDTCRHMDILSRGLDKKTTFWLSPLDNQRTTGNNVARGTGNCMPVLSEIFSHVARRMGMECIYRILLTRNEDDRRQVAR
jgi:hypothetical protein